jgi:hypothetical protein
MLNVSRRNLERKLGNWGGGQIGEFREAGMLIQIGESSATVTPWPTFIIALAMCAVGTEALSKRCGAGFTKYF